MHQESIEGKQANSIAGLAQNFIVRSGSRLFNRDTRSAYIHPDQHSELRRDATKEAGQSTPPGIAYSRVLPEGAYFEAGVFASATSAKLALFPALCAGESMNFTPRSQPG